MDFIHFDGQRIPYKVVVGLPNRTAFRFEKGILVIETRTGRLDPFDLLVTEKRKKWICKYYPIIAERQRKVEAFIRQVSQNKQVLYKGNWIDFDLQSNNKRFSLIINDKCLSYHTTPKRAQNRTFIDMACEAMLNQAKKEIAEMTYRMAESRHFNFNRVVVKYVSTKWGSCSSNRNININWHAIHLRQEVIEYLILHELCHLKHMNHSKDFWALVASHCPNYKALDAEIKQNGWLINIYEDFR